MPVLLPTWVPLRRILYPVGELLEALQDSEAVLEVVPVTVSPVGADGLDAAQVPKVVQTTVGVSRSLPLEMSLASRTYCPIAHISGVPELSAVPRVQPLAEEGVLLPQTCSEIWPPELAAPCMVASIAWASVLSPSDTSYSPRSPVSTGQGLPTPEPV